MKNPFSDDFHTTASLLGPSVLWLARFWLPGVTERVGLRHFKYFVMNNIKRELEVLEMVVQNPRYWSMTMNIKLFISNPTLSPSRHSKQKMENWIEIKRKTTDSNIYLSQQVKSQRS